MALSSGQLPSLAVRELERGDRQPYHPGRSELAAGIPAILDHSITVSP